MRPPNSMDDFFDIRTAFRRYEKNYNKWQNATFDDKTGHDKNDAKSAAEEAKAARRTIKWLRELSKVARTAYQTMEHNGWGRHKYKKRPKSKSDSRGNPVLSDVGVARALIYCLKMEDGEEDALGHALCLLHRLRQQEGYAGRTIEELNAKWGIDETDGGRR